MPRPRLLTLTLSWAFSTAAAAGEDPLWRARHALETGDPERAVALTAAWLHQDWSAAPRRRPEAVALHVEARVRGLGEGPELVAGLRPRWEAEPDDPELRLALAAALAAGPGPDCGELEPLLFPRPPAPWAMASTAIERRLAEPCGWTPAPLVPAVDPATAPEAELWILQDIVKEGVLEERDAYRLEDWYRAHPAALALPGNLFAARLSGPGLPIARLALEAAAQRAGESDDPMAVYGALQVARWQGRDERGLARRMDQLQPGWTHGDHQSDGTRAWMPPAPALEAELLRRLHEAARHDEPRVALHALKALRSELPPTPEALAAWHGQLGAVYAAMDRGAKALAAYEDAWLADPTDRTAANRFAWAAAEQDKKVDLALEAITAALATPPAFSARAGGLGAWSTHRDWSAHEEGLMRDTRAWLLYRKGRLHEARDELRRALFLLRSESGSLHMHLGLVLVALDQEEEALFHLGRGLAVADPEYDDLALIAAATEAAAALWTGHRWQPGGLEAWIAAQRPQPPARMEPVVLPADRPEGAAGGAGAQDILAATWVGDPLPDLELLGPGGRARISSVAGWRVVDFWAAWCGPCVEGLPALKDRVAAEAGLSLVVVSVEDAPPDWGRWLGDAERATGLWAGPAILETLALPGVPATFLIDPAGTVQAVQLGGGGLDWLDAALEARPAD